MEKCYKQFSTELIIIKIVPNDSLYTVFTKNILYLSLHLSTERQKYINKYTIYVYDIYGIKSTRCSKILDIILIIGLLGEI